MAGKELIHYGELLHRLKKKIKTARQKAILVVNNELLNHLLGNWKRYYRTGKIGRMGRENSR